MKAKIIVRTRTLIGTNALHVHLQYQMLVSTLYLTMDFKKATAFLNLDADLFSI